MSMLLLSQISFVSSLEITAHGSQLFVPCGLIAANESIYAKFQFTDLHAVFLWTPQSGNDSVLLWLSITSHKGDVSADSMTRKHGVRVSGSACTIRFQTDVTLEIWFIPASTCVGPSIVYSAANVFMDEMKLKRSYAQICFFFLQFPRLHFRIDRHQSNSTLISYSNSDFMFGKRHSIGGRVYEIDVREPTFFALNDVNPDRISLYGKRKGLPTANCFHEFMPLVSESAIRVSEIESDSGNMFSCVNDDLASDYSLPYVFLGIMGLIMAGLPLMVLFGWYSKMKIRLRMFLTGERDVNLVVDPKKLLKRDQIEDIVPVILDEAEEEMAEREQTL
jgi:hypothetical protein